MKNRSKKIFSTRSLSLVFVAGLVSGNAHAAVIFSDDFEGHTLGSTLQSVAQWSNSNNFTSNNAERSIQNEASSTAFGTPNQYVRMSATNMNSIEVKTTTNYGQTYNALTMFSFDFLEPAGGGNGDALFGYTTTRLNNDSYRARFSLNDGVLGGVIGGIDNTYSLDTTYRVFMVFNDMLTSQTYNGEEIAGETAAIWLQESGGPMVFAGFSEAANSRDTNGYAVAVTIFNSQVQTVMFDNVLLEVVPEPSTALLGGGGLLALLRRRR